MPQGDKVRNELRRHAVAALDLGGVHKLGALLAAGAHVEDLHAVVRALIHVPVAGHHECAAAGLGLEPCERAEQVVGLEGVAVGDDPAEGFEEGPRVQELRRQLVRDLGALCVVAVEQLHAVVRRVRPEAEHHGARAVLLDLAQDQVRGAEQGVHGLAVRALDGVREGVEGSEQHRWRIDDE